MFCFAVFDNIYGIYRQRACCCAVYGDIIGFSVSGAVVCQICVKIEFCPADRAEILQYNIIYCIIREVKGAAVEVQGICIEVGARADFQGAGIEVDCVV